MTDTTDQKTPPVALDLSLCKACGICIALCPQDVFDATDLNEPVVARPDECTACLLCELHCPDFAIEVRRRPKKQAVVDEDVADEDVADKDHAAHAGRVYAALASQPGDRDERPGGVEKCDTHEEP